MRKALTLLGIVLVILILGLLACSDNNNPVAGDFNGSDPIVKEFRIGNVPITAGGTFDVPLGEVNKLSFVLNEEVDPVSFVEFLDIKITIFNQDTGSTLILNRPTMLENGSFYVLGDNKLVEYRLLHYMDRVWIGGVPMDPAFASPGDTLEVTVQNVGGKNRIGEWFAFRFDTFKVVFSISTP